MFTLSPETEALVQAKAIAVGKTPDELIREALTKTADALPTRHTNLVTKNELLGRIDEIARRHAARSTTDPRPIDETVEEINDTA